MTKSSIFMNTAILRQFYSRFYLMSLICKLQKGTSATYYAFSPKSRKSNYSSLDLSHRIVESITFILRAFRAYVLEYQDLFQWIITLSINKYYIISGVNKVPFFYVVESHSLLTYFINRNDFIILLLIWEAQSRSSTGE